jgi:hypothetical protein
MSDASWSFAEAALGGTSYLRLPPLLQWFTGNIGFHDVDPRIPNYRLEECHNAMPGFNRRQRSRCARRFALWDNDLERLCRFASSAAGEWKSALFAPGTAVAYSFARYEQRGPLCCHSVRWCAKRCSKESHAAPCGGPLLH